MGSATPSFHPRSPILSLQPCPPVSDSAERRLFGAPLLKGLLSRGLLSHPTTPSALMMLPDRITAVPTNTARREETSYFVFPPTGQPNHRCPLPRSPSPRLAYPRISTPAWQSPGAPLQQVPPRLFQLPTRPQPCRRHPRIRPSAGSFGGRDHGVRKKARSAGPLPELLAAAPAHPTAARRDPRLCRR